MYIHPYLTILTVMTGIGHVGYVIIFIKNDQKRTLDRPSDDIETIYTYRITDDKMYLLNGSH
jgi:hypothetical protein